MSQYSPNNLGLLGGYGQMISGNCPTPPYPGADCPPPAQIGCANRILPLGFDSVATVAAAGRFVADAVPSVSFRPVRIAVPSSIADRFSFDQLMVGNQNQTPNGSTSIPAQVFTEAAVDMGILFDQSVMTLPIKIGVTNDSLVATRFRAVMLGLAAQSGGS